MQQSSTRYRTLASVALILALAGCGGAQQPGNSALASLDTRLTNGMVAEDKAVADAAAGRKPIGAPAKPAPASPEAATPTLGQLVDAQKAAPPRAAVRLASAEGRAVGGCAGRDLRYGARWVDAMPDGLGLIPGATLAEAAGSDTDRCALRVVSFTTADSPEKVVATYTAQVRRAGFDAERLPCRDEIRLGGTRASDDSAYLLFVRRKGSVTEVDIIASRSAA